MPSRDNTSRGGDARWLTGVLENRVKRLATINFDDERGLLCPIDFATTGLALFARLLFLASLGPCEGGMPTDADDRY